VKPNVWRRFLAEWWLAKNVNEHDAVICFGNLPPLFRLPCHVTVFLQNRYLVDYVKLDSFPLKMRLRLMIERMWLLRKMSNANEFVVQTPSMKRLLETRTTKVVHLLPFMAHQEGYKRTLSTKSEQRTGSFNFFYVASGEPHKNHQKLIEAWCLLSEQGLFPSLRLTLDKSDFPELCSWIERMITRYGLFVENLGRVSHERVLELYASAEALIYPSTFESFGVPLIEARQAGLSILASESDYVRDVIDPEQTFDPGSAVSIARAVKRHLGQVEAPLPLQDAEGFFRHIFTRTASLENSDC